MSNPFTLTFGKRPANMIERQLAKDSLVDIFSSDMPSYQVAMISGIRGAGKTVFLTSVASYFRNLKGWTVIDLSPEYDMVQSLASSLSRKRNLLQIFEEAKINISIFGVGIEIKAQPPITTTMDTLNEMLSELTKKGERILITIDEVASTGYMKQFLSLFQIYLRNDYNVFLLMTGLYENIYNLQNDDQLTFLYRAPKIHLEPLSIQNIARKYAEIFSLNEKDSIAMAKQTNGYPFAYQALGFVCFERKKKWREVIDEYDSYLEEYAYDKIFSELSEKEKEICFLISQTDSDKVEAIRSGGHISSNVFSVYRDRLLKKGVLISPAYGKVQFYLPRFKEFLNRKRLEFML